METWRKDIIVITFGEWKRILGLRMETKGNFRFGCNLLEKCNRKLALCVGSTDKNELKGSGKYFCKWVLMVVLY